jgi:hypothetical protein
VTNLNRLHYDIAHQKLTDYLLHFCVSRIHGLHNAESAHPQTFGAHAGFVSTDLSGQRDVLHKGDLLLLTGHRDPKWRMAWLNQVKSSHRGTEYLVQSTCGEGEVTWIDNIDIAFFHRPTLKLHPEWRWTNEQHQLADQWMECVMANRDTRLIAPMMPVFFGDSVRLNARGRFGISDFKPSKTISDFRELTQHSLLSIYDELCQMLHTDTTLKAEVDH